MDDDGGVCIAEALTINKTLYVMVLERNNLNISSFQKTKFKILKFCSKRNWFACQKWYGNGKNVES